VTHHQLLGSIRSPSRARPTTTRRTTPAATASTCA